MGKARQEPARNYERKHSITKHAIERFREYGTDVAMAAPDSTLGDILDEELSRAIAEDRLLEHQDVDRMLCWLAAFTQEYWANTGLYMLIYDDNRGARKAKQVRTMLVRSAVLDMQEKGKLFPIPAEPEEQPKLKVVPPQPEHLQLLQEVQDLKEELERVEAENSSLREENASVKAKIDRLVRLHLVTTEVTLQLLAGEK